MKTINRCLNIPLYTHHDRKYPSLFFVESAMNRRIFPLLTFSDSFKSALVWFQLPSLKKYSLDALLQLYLLSMEKTDSIAYTRNMKVILRSSSQFFSPKNVRLSYFNKV